RPPEVEAPLTFLYLRLNFRWRREGNLDRVDGKRHEGETHSPLNAVNQSQDHGAYVAGQFRPDTDEPDQFKGNGRLTLIQATIRQPQRLPFRKLLMGSTLWQISFGLSIRWLRVRVPSSSLKT